MNKKADIGDYLLSQMGDEKRRDFEDRIFADDEYFFELCETEFGMADRYISGEMKGDEAARFETAMKANPNVALTIANARILGEFIRSTQGSGASTVVSRMGFLTGIRNLFKVSPVPAVVFVSALIVVLAACAFLFVENRWQDAEITRLESVLTNSDSSQREAELVRDLTNSQARENDLQEQVDNERDISGDLASDLARERVDRRRLEKEVSVLRKSDLLVHERSGEQTVSVLQLDANSSIGTEVQRMDPDGPERISLQISVPANVRAGTRVSLRLNGREIARNIAVRQNSAARSTVGAVINVRQLDPGQNTITVHDSEGAELTRYTVER